MVFQGRQNHPFPFRGVDSHYRNSGRRFWPKELWLQDARASGARTHVEVAQGESKHPKLASSDRQGMRHGMVPRTTIPDLVSFIRESLVHSLISC